MDEGKRKIIEDWFDRALTFEEKQEWKKAAECYVQVTKLDPHYVDGWIGLATALLKAGEITEAKSAYQKALELDRENVTAMAGLAKVYENEGDIDSAVKYYIKAGKLSSDPAYYSAAAKLFTSRGDIEKAIEIYKTAVSLKEDARIFEKIGDLYIKIKDVERAISSYRRSLSIDPENYELWAKLGNLFMGLQMLDDAETCFKKALKINPVFEEAKIGLKELERVRWELLPEDEKQRILREKELKKQEEIRKLKEKVEKESSSSGFRCPGCGRSVEPHWSVCPYCNTPLQQRTCPSCGRSIDPKWVTCPFCGHQLTEVRGSGELPRLSEKNEFISTGIESLDYILGNGLPPRSVIFLIYDTDSQIGAELFLLNFIKVHLQQEMPVIYISDQEDLIRALGEKFGFDLSSQHFHFVDVKQWTAKLKNKQTSQQIENVFGLSDSDLILQEGKYALNSIISRYPAERQGLIVCDFIPYFMVEIDEKEIQKLIITMSSKLRTRFSVVVPADQNFMNILSPIKSLANAILRFRVKEENDRLISQFSALVNDETLKKWVNFRVKESSLEFF